MVRLSSLCHGIVITNVIEQKQKHNILYNQLANYVFRYNVEWPFWFVFEIFINICFLYAAIRPTASHEFQDFVTASLELMIVGNIMRTVCSACNISID